MDLIDADIESESDEDEDESSRSASVTAPARLTQRQAALAGMVEAPGHVVLGMSRVTSISD